MTLQQQTVDSKVVEVWGDDEFPIHKGTSLTVDVVDMVVISMWSTNWDSYRECCVFWRAPQSPEWRCVSQQSLPAELQTPPGWIKKYPAFGDLFEPIGRYAASDHDD